MSHRVKCPVCLSCLAPIWIMPNRYYFCDFCLTYYGGRDGAFILQDKQEIYRLIKENQSNEQS